MYVHNYLKLRFDLTIRYLFFIYHDLYVIFLTINTTFFSTVIKYF